MLMTSALLLAALLAALPQARAQQACGGKLPDAKAVQRIDQAGGPEKFRLIAQQCNVLDGEARLHHSAQLDLYNRGPASVTIRMADTPADPYASPDEPQAQPQMLPAPRRAPAPVLDDHGRRILVVAPALLAAARANGVDPLLMHAIAHVESRHNAAAVSHAGARGVMQVMPATGKRFGAGSDAERSLLDANTNTQAGAAYVRTLQQRFGGDLQRVLAAYNAGEGAVDKYKGVPPYAETQAYVRDVTAVYRRLQKEFSVSPTGDIVAKAGS
jgi:soluble lytic murein transglycosylase-like protein